MRAKGYRTAGIGEGIDHSAGKQNYIGVTFDVDSLPDSSESGSPINKTG